MLGLKSRKVQGLGLKQVQWLKQVQGLGLGLKQVQGLGLK
jgi:hypothetical protein